jgi:hypothetical protein
VVRIGLAHMRRTESGQGPVVRVSADRSFFVVLAAFGVGGGVVFGLVSTPTPFFLSASFGFVFAIFTFSVVAGFGLGRGWVQIGPEGISGLTYRGRRVVPWQEARFVEWIPYLGGYRAFGLNVPALAAYRERPSETGSRRAEPLMYLRMRLIVTRRQQVAVARQFFEACRGYGASTSVHRAGSGLVHEEMLREIEK